MSSPPHPTTDAFDVHVSRNPPPFHRRIFRSGHMQSNAFTGPPTIERGPVDFTSNRTNNVPDRFELFLLGEGEKKITIIPETRIPNACTFLFKKEDHTLANLLRSQLLKSPAVLFSGYKVPHPLFAEFELRIQTDGSVTPKAALITACREIVSDLDKFDREFTKEWELKKISRMAEDGTAPAVAGPSGTNGASAAGAAVGGNNGGGVTLGGGGVSLGGGAAGGALAGGGVGLGAGIADLASGSFGGAGNGPI